MDCLSYKCGSAFGHAGFIILGAVALVIGIAAIVVALLALRKSFGGSFRPAAEKSRGTKSPVLEQTVKAAGTETGEAAAAIGLALAMVKIKNSSRQITVKRVYRSGWKESLRSGAMDRL